jgi:hypothetical protein
MSGQYMSIHFAFSVPNLELQKVSFLGDSYLAFASLWTAYVLYTLVLLIDSHFHPFVLSSIDDFKKLRMNTMVMNKPSTSASKKGLSPRQHEELLRVLKTRFEENMSRHKGLDWAKVQAKLEANPEKVWSLNEMERTGGEPDVVRFDKKTGEFIFYDCSAESPTGRRNVCYDREGQDEREKKGIHPNGNVIDMAAVMGIEPLAEEQYRELQKLGSFDTKTQSWVKTPSDIRELGGAIFADRRYDHVFVYHNSAPSFYSGRAFRGSLRV